MILLADIVRTSNVKVKEDRAIQQQGPIWASGRKILHGENCCISQPRRRLTSMEGWSTIFSSCRCKTNEKAILAPWKPVAGLYLLDGMEPAVGAAAVPSLARPVRREL